MKATFKVHKVEPRDIVDGVARCELITFHPIDPHEAGAHEHAIESRSGEGQIKLKITEPKALGRFSTGDYVEVSFDVLKVPTPKSVKI
jgi:hypothetical protein